MFGLFKFRRLRELAMLTLLSVSLTACVAPPPVNTNANPAHTQSADGPFHLGAGDRVHVTVFGADQVSGNYAVDLAGNVAIPLAGTIAAGGATSAELGSRIAAKLHEQHLIENAQVSVEVIGTRPVYVLGEVEKPGEYPFQAGLNVVSAVAVAGGFKYRADQDFVFVRRGGQGEEQKIPFSSAAPIFPGDIVRIPSRNFF
jgi:polysaccharide export outer membrane protein